MNYDLRKEISKMVSRAIDSSVNYSGEEYDQNRHNWVQITTDRAIEAVLRSLPEPVDINSKYEGAGLHFSINLEEITTPQLDFLCAHQHDQGYNHYYQDYTYYLKELYSPNSSVIQSENEQNGIHGEEDSDSSNKEPSKVR